MYSRFKEQEYKLHFLEAIQSFKSRRHLLYKRRQVFNHSSTSALVSSRINSVSAIHGQHMRSRIPYPQVYALGQHFFGLTYPSI